MRNSILITMILMVGYTLAQERKAVQVTPPSSPKEPVEIGPDEIVSFPDVYAEFPGGSRALVAFIRKNLRYPEVALKNKDMGRVYVIFVVEKDGSITNIDLLRGGLTEELNEEAKRLVSIMPPWKPGEMNGTIVRSRCRMPLTFHID